MVLLNPRVRLVGAFIFHFVLLMFWAYLLFHPDNGADRVFGAVFMCGEALVIGMGMRKRNKQ